MLRIAVDVVLVLASLSFTTWLARREHSLHKRRHEAEMARLRLRQCPQCVRILDGRKVEK